MQRITSICYHNEEGMEGTIFLKDPIEVPEFITDLSRIKPDCDGDNFELDIIDIKGMLDKYLEIIKTLSTAINKTIIKAPSKENTVLFSAALWYMFEHAKFAKHLINQCIDLSEDDINRLFLNDYSDYKDKIDDILMQSAGFMCNYFTAFTNFVVASRAEKDDVDGIMVKVPRWTRKDVSDN